MHTPFKTIKGISVWKQVEFGKSYRKKYKVIELKIEIQFK